MMPLNPNRNRRAFGGLRRIVPTLGVVICMAFPAMALGQSSGDKYAGKKTQNQFDCETPGPLSCPYPPSPPLTAEGPPMSDKTSAYQVNLKEDPNEYYQTGKGKLPAQPTVPK